MLSPFNWWIGKEKTIYFEGRIDMGDMSLQAELDKCFERSTFKI